MEQLQLVRNGAKSEEQMCRKAGPALGTDNPLGDFQETEAALRILLILGRFFSKFIVRPSKPHASPSSHCSLCFGKQKVKVWAGPFLPGATTEAAPEWAVSLKKTKPDQA